jgi:alkaline phosphatase D
MRRSLPSFVVVGVNQLIEPVKSFGQADDRQYRTDNPCGDGESLRCAAASTATTRCSADSRNDGSPADSNNHPRWSVVAQQLLIAQLEHRTIQPNWFWNDARFR